MDQKNNNILGFEFDLICEYFLGLERQGPGSPEATLKALSFIDNLNENSQIADLGCGTGGQTLTLARHTTGHITGLDLFPAFIDRFNRNAAANCLQDRVKGLTGSMDDLPFDKGSLDLIWSEGAIYNIGFERGFREWREYLKPGGYLAVTDGTWFTPERPAEIHDFWMEVYPQIATLPDNVRLMQDAGYIPVAAFILPGNCWSEHYYAPQAAARELFLNKYAGNKTAEEFISFQRREEDLYARYKEFYGYAFYIGRKPGE